jgi:hypothetical protein
MLNISETTTFRHTPAEVFEAAADPNKQLEWDQGSLKRVEKLGPGPLGTGARYRGDFKGFGVMEYDYPEFEPGRRFVHRSMVPMGEMRHTFEFEAVPEGTRLTQTIVMLPTVLGRLMAPFMRGMLRKRLVEVGTKLHQYLNEV